jgi:hypothetical protein
VGTAKFNPTGLSGGLIADPANCVGLGIGSSPVGPIQDLIEQEIASEATIIAF